MLNSRIGYSINALDKNRIKNTNKIIDMGDKTIKQTGKTFIAALIIVVLSCVIDILGIANVFQVPKSLPILIYLIALLVELSPFLIYLLKIAFLEFKQSNNK